MGQGGLREELLCLVAVSKVESMGGQSGGEEIECLRSVEGKRRREWEGEEGVNRGREGGMEGVRVGGREGGMEGG